VFEIIVVLVVVGAGWFYLSMNKNDTEGSAPGDDIKPVTTQTNTENTEVIQTPAPVKTKPAAATKAVSNVPEDSALRRHYLQNLATAKESLETPFPEDSALRRHYLQNQEAEQGTDASSADESKAPVVEEISIPASTKTDIPVEKELKRDVIQQLVAETEATMPPRPTDSTLKRHYDAQLMSVVLSKLQASK
jgi:hypothetical protein